MLRKESFLNQTAMYTAVIDAHFDDNNEFKLEFSDLQALHYCLNVGIEYLTVHDVRRHDLQKQKLRIKEAVEEIAKKEGIDLSRKKDIRQISIEDFYYCLSFKESTEQDVCLT